MRRLGLFVIGVLLALAATPARAIDFADEALLEFLGSFDDGDGNWLDPLELVQLDALARARAAKEEQMRGDDNDDAEGDAQDGEDDDER